MNITQQFLSFQDDYIGQNETLKDDLIKIEGVPNATYVVKDKKVFVFDKLIQLVNENRGLSEVPLADLALSLIAEATVSAKEAVEVWQIVPEPYESTENSLIRHSPFNARLPGVFQSKIDVQSAFANLLLGGIQPGKGEFAYRGQSMTLCDPLDTALLPPRPVIHRMEGPDLGTTLRSLTYEPGFEPVSEALFDEVKELEAAWWNDSTRAARYAQEHAADIWALVAELQLETLDEPTEEVSEYGQDDLTELRALYPELSMLSDGSLYAWFDEYQLECCYINSWTASRDDEFLFYLLGKVALVMSSDSSQHQSSWVNEIGQWAAFALLRGDRLLDALAFGRAAALYDSNISRLARRIMDAILFLAEDKQRTQLQGGTVTTIMDCYRMARSEPSRL